MSAKSKKQQKFMGMVHACQKDGKCASEDVKKVAKSIKKKDAEDFASTKHKGLPEKVKPKKKLVAESLNELILESSSYEYDAIVDELQSRGYNWGEADFAVGSFGELDDIIYELGRSFDSFEEAVPIIADEIEKSVFGK